MSGQDSSNKLNQSPSQGGVVIEFSISILILVVLVFGLIDFSRYVAIKNLLETGANRALALASYIPNLERLDNDPLFVAARDSVFERARQIPMNTLVDGRMARFAEQSIDEIVQIPGPLSGQPNRETSFPLNPIVITLTAQMRSVALPWLPEMTITSRALGFREPDFTASNPIPRDCLGQPMIPGLAVTCPCQDPLVYNSSLGQCVCPVCPPNQVLAGGSDCACHCNAAAGYIPNPNGNGCICANECRPGEDRVQNSCSCQCPQGLVWRADLNMCECPLGQTFNSSGVCECSNICDGGRVPTGSTCTCQCPGSLVWNPQANPPRCECPGIQVQNGSTCSCPGIVGDAACPGNQVRTGPDCSCVCPAGTTWNSETTQCACPGAQQYDGTRCICRTNCATGLTPIPPDCQCQCPTPRIPYNGQCVCPQACGGGATQDQFTCACECGPETCPYRENGLIIACLECIE